MLNKTPTENEYSNIYEIEKVDKNLITKLINSRFIGDGIYTIEQLSLPEYKELYLTSPSFDKYNYKQSNKEWTFNEGCDVYELVLEKPMFMPLDVEQFVGLFESLSEIEYPIFTQVLLCKRTDNWREEAIHLYDQFLKGNEHPIDNKMIVKMQENFLKVLSKVGNFNMKREPIEEIDNKILQNNYRFECRVIILDSEYSDKCIKQIYRKLGDLNLFNRLVLKQSEKLNFLLESINKRRFQSEHVNQLLSEQELYSLLCKEGVETEVSPTKKMRTQINQTSLIKVIQSNHLSGGVECLPSVTRKSLDVDNKIVKEIQQAFSRVKISKEKLQVTNVVRGSRLQKIEIKIPSDKNFSDIKKNVENLKGALGKEDLSIEIGDKPETVNLFIACEDTELIHLKQILQSKEFQEFSEKSILPFIIGEDVVGNPLFACLSNLRHLLIAGATGSGKSVFLNCLLICLILCVNPDELALYLIDPKMVELKPYEGLPQVQDVITDMRKAATLLDKLTIEMDIRYKLLSEHGYRDVQGYNKNAKNKIPYIVVVVDEYADLMETNSEVETHIQRLGAKARGAGIHLVIATQRPSSDILDGAIKSNLPSRISFKLETSSDYLTVFGNAIPFKPLGRGDGCARIEGLPKTYQRFQSPIITLDDDEWMKVMDNLKSVFMDIKLVELELAETIPADEPIDKLKKIIASSGELRISELQSQMGIGIGKVTELMRQLVDEEWLRKEGRSYEINVDDEELSKWRNVQ